MIKDIIIIFLLLLIYFLRSPERSYHNYEKGYVYSPCDGKILEIGEKDEFIRIVYYLNFFDNHTQYFPIESIVLKKNRYHGKNYKAYSINSDKNSNVESILYNIDNKMTYKLTQRTGIIARRILHYAKPDVCKKYKTGEKLGFIIFGSRVDIDIPKNMIEEIFVKPGDKIKGIVKIIKLKKNTL